MGRKSRLRTDNNREFAHGRGDGRCGTGAAAAVATLDQSSDDSLDEQLLDYLQNINKQQHDSDTGASPQRLFSNFRHDTPSSHQVDETANSSMRRGIGNLSPIYDPGAWRPGLGFQHGFTSTSAAVQFSAVSLDDALEGQLRQDMQLTNQDAQPKSSSSGTTSPEGSEDSSSDTSSSGLRMVYNTSNPGHSLLNQGLSEPLVVDAAGRPQQAWHDLGLQQRYPVQLRQEVVTPGDVSSSRSANRQQQRGPPRSGTQTSLTDSINSSILVSSLPSPVPAFQSQCIASTVTAAISAAAELAKQYVARHATLVQQLQQAQQNHSKQPGKQGRGAKKQLKKAKVAAKRSARQSRSGSGALQLVAALEAFVTSGQDMQVLPPVGSKQKEGLAKQLAGLFGVVAAAQGGGSSGRTCLVLQRTPHMHPELDADTLKQLQQILQAQLAVEMSCALIARDSLPSIFKEGKRQKKAPNTHPINYHTVTEDTWQNQTATTHPTSQPTFREDKSQQNRPSAPKGLQKQGSKGSLPVQTPDYQRPVSFVAGGIINPASSTDAQQDHSQSLADDRQQAGALHVSDGDKAVECSSTIPLAFNQYNMQLASAAHPVATAGFAYDNIWRQQQQQQQQRSQQQRVAEMPYAEQVMCSVHTQGSFGMQVADAATHAAGAGASLQWCEDKEPRHSLPVQHERWRDTPAYETSLYLAVEAQAGGKQVYGAAPIYNRAGIGLGVSAVEHEGITYYSSDPRYFQEQGSGLPASTVHQHALQQPGSSIDHIRLAQLEAEFRMLQTQPDELRRQQEWQQQVHHQRQGQRVEDEEELPSALEQWVAAAESGSAQVTFNMTAQQSKKAKKKQQRSQRRECNRAAAVTAGGRGGGGAAPAVAQSPSVGFAAFEVHTSGIGSRLLSRWGWREGEGLGRGRQGRAEPLQAERRAKQQGLGYD